MKMEECVGILSTKIAYENWVSKYRYNNETPVETVMRCAIVLASVEKDSRLMYERFMKLMLNFDDDVEFDEMGYPDREPKGFKATLGGRITANIGTSYKNATLMNCFINGPVSGATIKYSRASEDNSIKYDIEMKTSENPDDLNNIFLTILEQAKTLAAEGGYGLNFGFIRPRGSIIKGTGIKHPGVVSYMKVWDAVSDLIVKGDEDGYVDRLKNHLDESQIRDLTIAVKAMARKGAMLASLPCFSRDTDILTDRGWMNIVDLIDEVEDGDDIFAVDEFGNLNEIYDPIVREPEEIYELELEDGSKIEVTKDHKFEAENIETNEVCLKALKDINVDLDKLKVIEINDAYLNVLKGNINIDDVKVILQSEDDFVVVFKKINRVLLKKNDFSYDFTVANVHRIIAKHTDSKNAFYTSNCNHPDIEEFIRAKQVRGVLTKFNISVLIDDKFMLAVEKNEMYDLVFKGNVYKRVNAVELYDLIMGSVYNRAEPGALFYDNMHRSNPVSYMGHCDSTNPCIIGSSMIATVNGCISIKFLAEDGSDVKVYSYNCDEDKYEIKYGRNPRRTGINKEVWKLDFVDGSNFIATPDHRVYLESGEIKELKDIIIGDKIMTFDSYTPMVVSCVGFYGHEDVYNITVDDNHNYIVVTYGDKKIQSAGIVVKNCGEVPGLSSITTVCLLGSFNLTQYVYKDGGYSFFNWRKYSDDIFVFARMLDNVNDLANAPLPSYEYVIKKMRQFGMGINGLGSTLMMMKIAYNSEEALEFTKKLCEIKENLVWQASALLAKEKGVFEAYDAEKFQTTEYFKSDRLWPETKELIRKNGVRNAKTTTAPPLGNSSILCDNVSNGIEPVFLLQYERKVICKWPKGLTVDNIKDVFVKHNKVDYEYWQGEYDGVNYYYEPHNRGLCEISVIRDYGYQWLLDNYPEEDHSKYLITTNDLNVSDHINVQRVVQYYCNQSVSKTCNVPKDYLYSDFKKLYLEAWRNGLVGFTAYRDGCMESVISSIEKAFEDREIIKKDIVLPPEFLNGPTSIIKREGIKFYIHFSYLPEDKMMKYPICLWIYSNSKESGQAKVCNLASRKLAKLALQKGIEREFIVQCLDKAKKDYSYNRLGRLISLCLRHNVKREDILMVLIGIEGDSISSLLTAVRKFIAMTIKDGTRIKIKCGNCNGENVILESGCTKCIDCGATACG